MTPQEIEALKAERDALLAQVRSLQKEKSDLLVYVVDSEKWFNKHDPNGYVSPKRGAAQQCLREIQAEAGRDGFVAGFECRCNNPNFSGSYGILADQYAATVRQGESGTWLKDSNVNGGKRQGGAE